MDRKIAFNKKSALVSNLTNNKKNLLTVAALAALLLLVAWLVSGNSSKDSSQPATSSVGNGDTRKFPSIPATVVTKDELIAATKDLGLVIYWNGEMPDTNIELTVLTEGKVFVRYLPKDVPAGAADPYFTVATYFDPEGFARVQSIGSNEGAKYINYSGGAVAASSSKSDSNIYFAYDGNPFLYNIYSPDPKIGWDALNSATLGILN